MATSHFRTATLVLAFCGTFLNLAVALQLLSLWRSLRWETESEWEGFEKYRFDGLRVVWCLLSGYFTVAAMACLVGLIGVLKRIPSYVRLYRDYSVADLCISALSTIGFTFVSFRSDVRSAVCEELSRQPDFMRDLAEAGLNVENCESWFERAVIASVCLMGVSLVVRLQFTLTITDYHTRLLHSALNRLQLEVVRPPHGFTSAASPSGDVGNVSSSRRIYLLSKPETGHPASKKTSLTTPSDVVVYVPVPFNSLSAEDTLELDATEAWVPPTRDHHHRYRRSSLKAGRGRGPISLPIRPDEPLLQQTYDPQDELKQ